jgi:hypothetical protein
MHSISELFDRGLPHAFLPHPKTVGCRARMCASIAAILDAVEMVYAIEGTLSALRAQLVSTNESINGIFQQLKFPFSVRIADRSVTVEHVYSSGL